MAVFTSNVVTYENHEILVEAAWSDVILKVDIAIVLPVEKTYIVLMSK